MAYMFGASAALVLLPALAYAFVVFMVGYAVLVVDRLPVIAIAGIGDARVIGRATASPSGTAAGPVAPRLAAATNVVMALAMGYMLVLLFG